MAIQLRALMAAVPVKGIPAALASEIVEVNPLIGILSVVPGMTVNPLAANSGCESLGSWGMFGGDRRGGHSSHLPCAGRQRTLATPQVTSKEIPWSS
jgi:hypothetical protein